MDNQRCHPSGSIKSSLQHSGENDFENPPAPTTTTSDQGHNPRLLNNKSIKRYRVVDSMANTSLISKKAKTTESPPPPSPSPFPFAFTSLPTEIRLMILHHALTSAAGPNATTSTHPRSNNLPDPPTEPGMLPFYGPQQTQWHARRGLLHASSSMRAETLHVLYGDFAFFARMPLGSDPGFNGKARFQRWLKSLGGEREVERVGRVVFRVEWPAVRCAGGMKWFKGTTEVEVCVFGGHGRVRAKVEKVRALWAQEEELPWLCLEAVEETVGGLLVAKGERIGLGYNEWMRVWEKVEEVMRLQWF